MKHTLSERLAHAMAGAVIFGFAGALVGHMLHLMIVTAMIGALIGGVVSFFKYDALDYGGNIIRGIFGDRNL